LAKLGLIIALIRVILGLRETIEALVEKEPRLRARAPLLRRSGDPDFWF
jgi:hypothetical protein